MRKTVHQRFWEKVHKTEGCWIWMSADNGGTGTGSGHGKFHLNGKVVYAHRLSYEMENGPIPAGKVVDHICHNTKCVKPEHLRLVTQLENMWNRSGPTSLSTTGVRGVSWNPEKRKYETYVTRHGKRHRGGYFDTLSDAAIAINKLRKHLSQEGTK